MAADVDDDHNKKVHYGVLIGEFAKSAAEALRNGNPETMKGVLQYIINEAARNKLYWKRGEFE